ncbi:MAG: hypothetical protein H0V37_07100 [Chloroflexia bacterium]|nr:hypothetical protein [Chloroflexia bacterium]
MTTNPIKTDARHARRHRALPKDARCSCGEADARCLIPTGERVTCYACQSLQAGRSATERHHVAGRHNLDTTVPIPNNEHRILSDRQQDWPRGTFRNPDQSPLLQAAAAIRGWLDILILILERAVGWIPGFLEALDAWLCARIGPEWGHEFRVAHPLQVPPASSGGGR